RRLPRRRMQRRTQIVSRTPFAGCVRKATTLWRWPRPGLYIPLGKSAQGTGFALKSSGLPMIREADAIQRKQRFLLCRYALILVTGAVGLVETAQSSPVPVAILVGLAILSNLYLGTVPPFNFFDATMQAPILVIDTAMVSAVLLLARASQEFFLFFFFMLIMAAKIENLVALVVGAGLIGVTSLLFRQAAARL